jgi:DNA polymerase-1
MIHLSLIFSRIAGKGRAFGVCHFSAFVGPRALRSNLRPRTQARKPVNNMVADSSSSNEEFSNGHFVPESNDESSKRENSPKTDPTEPRRQDDNRPKFFPTKPQPPKARMFMGRELPPSVLEYDNNHYDEEFGAAKPGEDGYLEFHDGMLEEIEARETLNSFDTSKNDGNVKLETSMKKDWAPQIKPLPRPVASAQLSQKTISILKSSANGTGEDNRQYALQQQLEQIESEIITLNDGKEFNINSPKQVSMVLFGVENESTSKVALEALAGNISNTGGKSRMASLILQFRKYSRDLKRIEKSNEYKDNGTLVKDVPSMRSGKKKESELKVIPSSIVSPIESNNAEREPLVLIDASAYIFRAYYSMPAIHRYDGEPTGATLGFCNMLNKLVLNPMLKGEQPRIALIFDSKDGANFRKELYPDYKGNRPDCPEDLIPQFDFVRDAADAYGILQLEAPGYEADDVIATLSTMALREGCHVNILSGDKDLMQLVTKDDGGACIEMIDPMKMVRYCYDTVKEKWGVEPSQVGDVLALSGDSSDNIPGVPGIGPKTAASLIQEFGSLDALLENVHMIQQNGRREKLEANVELARLSRKLVELERNVPLDVMSFPKHFDGVSDFRMEIFDQERLLSFYDRMGFRDIKKRVQSRLPKVATSFSSSFSQRYSSILEDSSSSSKKSKQPNNDKRLGNGFSIHSNFIEPPKPEDYSDVPF